MAKHNELGKEGEQLAIDFLQQKGYKILKTNWRYLKAEVDIIASKHNILTIVEVKTRTSTFFGTPETFITKAKIKLLAIAANAYVEQYQLNAEIRFDVIAIVKTPKKTTLNHLKDAFTVFD